jgi:NAD+ synthase
VKLNSDCLRLDLEAEVSRIARRLREILAREVPRRGYVVAMSGGIDSSVSAALCVRAVGAGRVFGLLLPERDSADDSTARGRILAEHLGISFELFDIGPTLEAIGCYRSRDEAIRRVFSEYDGTWKNKIVIAGGLEGRINHFRLVVQTPSGDVLDASLGLREYLQLVAATNFKQRIRKTVEYYHADRLNYAVVGTPNRLEYDQGFFVKNGDGSADVKPIAHLYKTQVYAIAQQLGLPERICSATPTTDTYSLPQGQDEFYFALPYAQMDLALWAMEQGYTAAEIGEAIGLSRIQAERLCADIIAKRKAARHLHASAVLVEDAEIQPD